MKFKPNTKLETKTIHAGELSPRIEGAVALPIFQSATFESPKEKENYHQIRYARLSNTPNHLALHVKLAALESAEAALVTSSGMSAISTALMAVLRSGDRLLIQSQVYGGTHSLLTQDFPDLGIQFDWIDIKSPETWKSKIKPNTRAIYVEALSNPLLEIPDFKAVVDFARAHQLTSLIDSTFTSPVNFRPVEHGFDIVLHSATKYLNGHSDLIAGVVAGSTEWVNKITLKLNHFGGSLDPHACFLLHRGLKTLSVRVKQQNENALQIARFLKSHPAIEAVHYPGLETHPQHALARKYFDGFGGMLSFVLSGGHEATETFLGKLQLPVSAPSLGGVETLITRPSRTSHGGLTAEEKRKAGIQEDLIRLSVGIEAAEDLIADLRQALA